MSEMLTILLLPAAPLWPLLLALAPTVPGLRPVAGRLILSAPLPALLLALAVTDELHLEIPWILLGGQLGIAETSRLFLFVSALLWLVAGSALDRPGGLRLHVWSCLTMAGNFAVLLARDIPTFFFAYALMSLASFGLVIHTGSQAARYAAKVYLIFAVLGEMILLSALLWAAHQSQSLALPVTYEDPAGQLMMLMLFLGFGIKAGVPLLHFSLPPAYAVTPIAGVVPMAGALLHLGLYGWLSFLPLGQFALPVWSGVFLAAGVVAMFYGAGVGILQREPRALLAYSSMSQMGLMLLAIGIGLAAPNAWPTLLPLVLLFTLYHALAKGALFYGLGISGPLRSGLWLPALTLAGLPLTGGAWVKGLLKTELSSLPGFWPELLTWLLPLGSVATTLLMARFIYLSRQPGSDRQAAPLAWMGLLSALLITPWIWPLSLHPVSPVWDALWPILFGSILAWLVWRGYWNQALATIPSLPPGDLLNLTTGLARLIPVGKSGHELHARPGSGAIWSGTKNRLPTHIERVLGRWPVAMGLLLCVLLGLLLLLLAV